MTEDQPTNEATPRDLSTVRQFAQRFPAWTEPGIRNLLLYAADRINSRGERIPGNGLAEIGAIVRVGRRVLISEDLFFRWVANQQTRRCKAAA